MALAKAWYEDPEEMYYRTIRKAQQARDRGRISDSDVMMTIDAAKACYDEAVAHNREKGKP